MSGFQIGVAVVCVLVALVLLADLVADRRNTNPAFYGLAAVELLMLVQLVWGIAQVLGDHEGVSVAAYLGYLVGGVLIVPAGYLWSLSEKSRSGTAVLLVAVLVVPVLLLRLHDLWSAGA